MAFFPILKQNFIAYRSSQCLHVQIAFVKFINCDNQTLAGCIPIATVAVHLIGQSSQKIYNNYIENFQVSATILNA